MKTFLKQLDDMAGRLLNTIDDDLQQPITAVITGEVFSHEMSLSSNDNTKKPAQPAQNPVVPAATPARTPKTQNNGVRTPILQKSR